MKIRTCLILFVLATLLIPTLARAQAPEPVTLAVEAGLDGYYQIGQWLPVRVIVENNGSGVEGHLEVTLPRNYGGKVIYAYPVSLPTQSRKEIVLPLRPEKYTNRLQIVLKDNAGQVLTSQEQPLKLLNDTDQLYGFMADQPSAFNVLAEVDLPDGKARVAQLTPHNLPDQAAALDMLNTLIVSNIDTGVLTAAQRAALSAWVANGGRLIVAGGSGWQKTSAGLGPLLPLQPDSTITVDDLAALQSFARSSAGPGKAVLATGALAPGAQTVLKQGDTPLIVRRPHGFGTVTFLSFDPADFKEWDGLSEMYKQLAQTPPDKPGWSYGVQDWNSALTAASNIPNLNLPAVSLICSFLGIYMIAIGPLNYFIVRRLKRRELAWISVPLLALGFMATAFIAGNAMRGSQPVLNRLVLVQVWPDSGQARLTGIVGVYAPQRATYQVQADRGVLLHPASYDLPYQSIGDTADWTISGDADAQRAQVEMDVSEVKMLSAAGAVDAPQIAATVELIVNREGAKAVGTVTNNSELTLQNAVLLGPGQARPLGTLRPGDSIPVDFRLERTAHSSAAQDTTPSYYGSSGDTTLEDIAGQPNYNDPDPEQARRTNFLRSLLAGDNSSPGRGRGGGLYLAGWSDQSPLSVSVGDTPFGSYNTTLYIVDLSPSLKVTSGTLTLPPGMFTWQTDNLAGGPSDSIAPYDATLYPGTHALQFNLAQPIDYETVQDLTLHLAGSAVNSQRITTSLWNYRAKAWTPLPDIQFGENHITHPAEYVGPGGVIRLQIDTAGSAFDLERADFTLTVQ